MMRKTDVINSLIDRYDYKKYLEIGVQKKHQNFNLITCAYKICVDPDPNAGADYVLTSDDFFIKNKETFDIIFIDGLHYADQVYRDIINAIAILTHDGTIVCHDMLPQEEIEQIIPLKPGIHWTGDCWKAWVKFRINSIGFETYVVDTVDRGVGIIRRKNGEQVLTWEFFSKNKKEIMNIISDDEFERILTTINEK